jgi:superoxide dismutase
MAHHLAALTYDYDALESTFDALTMQIHHSKHHVGYLNSLNNALANVIHTAFGDFNSLKDVFSKVAAPRFGNG